MQSSLTGVVPTFGGSIRRSEWVVLVFLFYVQALPRFLPVAPAVEHRIVLWNWAIGLVYVILLCIAFLRPAAWVSITRDWLPLAVVLLAYREMGWLAQPHASALLESHWIVWDRVLLRGGVKAAIELFGPVLPSILEIAYSLVYTLAPLSIAVLYLSGYRDHIDRFLFVFILTVLLCYAQFPFWPSEPPRVLFSGQDTPAYDTVFRHFNLWMLGKYGIHTSVFPSAHVAGAFAAAFGMRQAAPARKCANGLLLLTAILIAVATVYGRYHYASDAMVGFLIAAAVSLACAFRPEKRSAHSGLVAAVESAVRT